MPSTRRGGPPEPLSRDESERLAQSLRRLASELRDALRFVPQHREGASALARALQIDRATAHRVLMLSLRRDPGPEVLLESPGAEAMDQLAEAIARTQPETRSASTADIASLRTAIAHFRRTLAELGGGSKSRLIRRIAATAPARDERDADRAARASLRARREQELREQLFAIVSELIGRSTETRIDMMICRPNAEDAKQMDYAQVRGVIGHRARAQSQPMSVELIGRVTQGPKGAPDSPRKLDGSTIEDSVNGALLQSFSTRPLPMIVSRGLGDRVRNVVDPAFAQSGNPIDIVMGYQRARAGQHPMYDPVPSLEVGALIREPTRALILDTWLHRDMIAGAVPSLETYLWSPTLETSLADHWLDRLPTSPLLTVLGRGLQRAASVVWHRHAELTSTAFEQLGWNANDYVGYRAEIAYPMWGAAYFAVFDYAK